MLICPAGAIFIAVPPRPERQGDSKAAGNPRRRLNRPGLGRLEPVELQQRRRGRKDMGRLHPARWEPTCGE